MKNKLLLTSALVGVVGLTGTANAEWKAGGDITTTQNFASADANGSTLGGQRFGTELNFNFTGTADLNNGWKATYTGRLEMDGNAETNPDHEYELKLGTSNAWLSIANDFGQTNAQWSTPWVSYPSSSTAIAATTVKMSADRYIAEVKESENLGFGAKVGNGTASFRYAPNTGKALGDDGGNVTIGGDSSATFGSGWLVAYKGELAPGLGLNAAYVKMQKNDQNITNESDNTEKRVGLSYKMGAITVGADRIIYEAGVASQTGDVTTTTLGAAYKVNDQVSVGVYYTKTTDDSTSTTKQDEEFRALSVGYNLGPASWSVNYVDIQGANLATTGTNADYKILQSVIKVAF